MRDGEEREEAKEGMREREREKKRKREERKGGEGEGRGGEERHSGERRGQK